MKRFFMSTYLAFILVGLVYFGFHTLLNYNLAFAGAFVSALGAAIYFIGIYTFNKTPRTSKKLWSYGLIIYSGLVISLAGLQSMPEFYMYLGLLFTALNGILWERYVSWYSTFPKRKTKLEIGKKLQGGSLLDISGNVISVNKLTTKKSIWLFYRGNWCPFCVAQVQELAGHYQALEKLGYQVLFVSSQEASKSKSLSDKFNINAQFLMDKDNTFGKSIGICDSNGLPIGLEILGYKTDVHYPTLLVTNEKGIVNFIDLTDNYRIRPEPEEILKIVTNLT